MWANVTVSVPPASRPISLDDMKTRLAVDHDDHDELIAALLDAAVATIDGPSGIGVAMMAQDWVLSLDRFPAAIVLPGAPVTSVQEVAYTDGEGVDQVLDPSGWTAVLGGEPARVVPAFGQAWPATRAVPQAVRVTYRLGAADAADVPADLVTATALLAAHFYAHREAVVPGGAAAPLPLGASWIMARHRRGAAGA